VAQANAEFFRRHPDWDARYGDRGRVRGEEDAGFLVEFLSGALWKPARGIDEFGCDAGAMQRRPEPIAGAGEMCIDRRSPESRVDADEEQS
jgi:hypothetical protein